MSEQPEPKRISEADINRLFEQFDKTAMEVNQMFSLIQQGVTSSIDDLGNELRSLKEQLYPEAEIGPTETGND